MRFGSYETHLEKLEYLKNITSGIGQESEEFQHIFYEEMWKMKVQEAKTEYPESAMHQTEQVIQAFQAEDPSLKKGNP